MLNYGQHFDTSMMWMSMTNHIMYRQNEEEQANFLAKTF